MMFLSSESCMLTWMWAPLPADAWKGFGRKQAVRPCRWQTEEIASLMYIMLSAAWLPADAQYRFCFSWGSVDGHTGRRSPTH